MAGAEGQLGPFRLSPAGTGMDRGERAHSLGCRSGDLRDLAFREHSPPVVEPSWSPGPARSRAAGQPQRARRPAGPRPSLHAAPRAASSPALCEQNGTCGRKDNSSSGFQAELPSSTVRCRRRSCPLGSARGSPAASASDGHVCAKPKPRDARLSPRQQSVPDISSRALPLLASLPLPTPLARSLLFLSMSGDLNKIPEYGKRPLTRGERIKPN